MTIQGYWTPGSGLSPPRCRKLHGPLNGTMQDARPPPVASPRPTMHTSVRACRFDGWRDVSAPWLHLSFIPSNSVKGIYMKERDFMNRLHTKVKSAPRGISLATVEWSVDAPFAVEVRVRRRPRPRSAGEKIRYVKLAVGIFNHCPSCSVVGLHRNRRTRRLDG